MRRLHLAVLVACAALAGVLAPAHAAAVGTHAGTWPTGEWVQPVGGDFRGDVRPSSAPLRRLADSGSWGETVTTSTGERIAMYASSWYTVDYSWLEGWANWMESNLFHGNEFTQLTVLFDDPGSIGSECGAPDVEGCYIPSESLLVAPGNNLPDGTNMATVLAHEYGHHLAANRVNPPWNAETWGPKYWASYANVCARVKSGKAFPGDEGDNYTLDPGEAFAETYRLAVYSSRDWGSWWGPDQWIVDPSWPQDSTALAMVKNDALAPWASGVTRPSQVVGRFTRTRRTVTTDVRPVLDGVMRVTLYRPAGARLTLIDAASGAALLTRNSSFGFTICGQRFLRLRVSGRPGQRYDVRVQPP